jgi:hypothetical protein
MKTHYWFNPDGVVSEDALAETYVEMILNEINDL